MLSLLYLVVKAQQHFVTSSCMFLDEKTVLEIWLNPGLNLTIFRGTGPRTWSTTLVKTFLRAALDSRNRFEQITHRYFYRARMFRHCLTEVQWQWRKTKLKKTQIISAFDWNPFTPLSRASQANRALSKTASVTLSPICICFEFPLFPLFYTRRRRQWKHQ